MAEHNTGLLATKQAKDQATAESAQPGTQVLRRGLRLLELVAESPAPLRFTDLLKLADIPKGTLHRLLQALIDARYLRFDGRDQTYRLGARLFEMAHKVWDEFDLRGAAEPELERLRDLSGEAVRLGILDAGEVLCIDQREVKQPLRLANGIGSRSAPHATALGKAILSHLSPSDRRALVNDIELKSFTPNTIVSGADLDQQLNLIKARAYAISLEELNAGINSVAAPILDHKARPLGAIGIVGPAFRLPEDKLHALGREVIEAARRIAGNVGELAMSITINPRPLGVDRDDVRCVLPGSDFLGEGPYWLAATKQLLWVDILAPAVLLGDPVTGERQSIALPELIGAIVPRAQGGFIAATENGFKTVDLGSGALMPLANPEADRPGNRFNDGKCDRQGRFWAGTLAINTEPGAGALWRLDPDGSVRQMDKGFHVSNGLGWSPDERLFYFTDSGKRTIYVYDFDPVDGTISNRREFVKLAEGVGTPDGLAVDAEGCVWSVHWDGWCITRYDPDGAVERVINLPVPRPTSCVFGGPDMSTLLVTSARIRLSAQQLAEAPMSGSVFAIDTGIKGLRSHSFAG